MAPNSLNAECGQCWSARISNPRSALSRQGGPLLGLFALFSSRDTPMRLHNKALVEAALFRSNSTVLTFAYCDRHSRAPFGLSWSDFKELICDPLCVEEGAFREWLRRQERKKVWPCHQLMAEARRSQGRPSNLIDEATEVIEELDVTGKLTSSMRNKEVHALVQMARPSLCEVSEETVRRARKQAHSGSAGRSSRSVANRPRHRK